MPTALFAAGLFADAGELGLPSTTAPMPWWVNALFMATVVGVNAYLLLIVRRADVSKIYAELEQKKEATRQAEDNSALAQWKAIARNEIKLRGEAEERQRKQMLEVEEGHNRKMADLVAATRTEVHELRNDLGLRITQANAEIADLRVKEWKCQKRMATFEGIARANGWQLPDGDGEDVPPPEES